MSKVIDLLAQLNEPQRQAATLRDGPILVLAGAGSGKTKTLVHRLAYLIAVHNVAPQQILAVTFTNQAAKEMRQRVQHLIGRQFKNQPTIGTFHSVSASFLRQEARLVNYPAHYSIYDEDDQLSLVKEVLKEQGLGLKIISPKAVLGAISRAKAELVGPENFMAWADRSPFSAAVASVYPRYQELLRRERAFDFDDLLMKMVEIWRAQPEILGAYQARYRYLLIDEYQDVNRAQYVWTKLLAESSRNLCVVGDDWQSIYSWRGADFGNLLRFHEDYPEATVIKLEQNYRSTKIIIEASNAIMSKAERKADKTLWTDNNLGEPISIVAVEDESAEASFVVNEVLRLAGGTEELSYSPLAEDSILPDIAPAMCYSGTGEELKDFAVLYRTNAQSRALEEACLKANLPYQLIGGTRFYERKEIKDVLAYLRLLVNPHDGVSFRRAVLASVRGLGLASVEAVLLAAQKQNRSPLETAAVALSGERKKLMDNFLKVVADLGSSLSKLGVADLIDLTMEKSGLKQELLDGTADGQARYQNVQELKTVAEERSPGLGFAALEQFLAEVALWQDQDNYSSRERGITLMTFHAAKGLEFDTVFMVGMEEGLFPHASSFDDPNELDEERRLAYVGFTRAREKIYCLYAFNRRLFGALGPGIPSRFLSELPKDCVTSMVGSRFI